MRYGLMRPQFEAMAQIKDYVAFYPDRVNGITQQSAPA